MESFPEAFGLIEDDDEARLYSPRRSAVGTDVPGPFPDAGNIPGMQIAGRVGSECEWFESRRAAAGQLVDDGACRVDTDLAPSRTGGDGDAVAGRTSATAARQPDGQRDGDFAVPHLPVLAIRGIHVPRMLTWPRRLLADPRRRIASATLVALLLIGAGFALRAGTAPEEGTVRTIPARYPAADGADPVAAGCLPDARLIDKMVVFDGPAQVGAVELEYSPHCDAGWARAYLYPVGVPTLSGTLATVTIAAGDGTAATWTALSGTRYPTSPMPSPRTRAVSELR
jgi:hypothetical protein